MGECDIQILRFVHRIIYRQLNRRLNIDNLLGTFYTSLTSLARSFCKQFHFCKQNYNKTIEMSDDTQAEMISMSYSELECIDQEDIIMLVDVESALKICQECLENNTNSSFDVLSLWFNKLLRAYMDEAICCFNAVKEMCEWFQMMVRLQNPTIFETKHLCFLLEISRIFRYWQQLKDSLGRGTAIRNRLQGPFAK